LNYMQCKNHPDRKAEHICTSCNAPLCDECAEEVKTGIYACFQCAMLQSVSEVGLSIKDKRERAIEKEVSRKKKWGPYQYFLIFSLVLILAMWGVIILGGEPAPSKTAAVLGKGKAGRVLLFLVDGALRRYAHYEGNKYPLHLTELVPKYLQLKESQVPCLSNLSYIRDPEPKIGYRLSIANSEGQGMKIILTPKGVEHIQPSGSEPK